MFKMGDRVVYISGVHGKSSNNPLAGTKYECQGTVVTQHKDRGFPIQVRWDNGQVNSYSHNDLEYVTGGKDRSNPNMAFLVKKLTKQKRR
jgi:hypothetical protein